MIIDGHAHVTENGKWFNGKVDASVERLLRQMDKAGINKTVLLGLPEYVPNEFIYKVCKQYSDKFIGAGGINPLKADCLDEVDRCYKIYEFSILKLHPRLYNFTPAGYECMKVLEKAEKLGMTVIFDAYMQSSSLLLADLEPFVYDKIAKTFPELKLVIAHMGYPKFMDAYAVARSNKNVYVDISYILHDLKGLAILNEIDMALRKIDRKVIYGSDFPEIDAVEYLENFKKLLLELPDEKKNNMLYLNSQQVFNITE